MRLSYNWLKEFVKIDLNPEQLADKLTLLGFEIEKIDYLGKGLDKVVVGEIKEIIAHPNADRLRITRVNVGSEILKIVCGAPNIEVGQKVPVAMIGAKLEAGGQVWEIKPSVIRGESSDGMLCAADELGLGDDHTGIMILDTEVKLGQTLSEFLGGGDAIYEFDVPANRGDVWSHLGMAREIAATLNEKVVYKNIEEKYTDQEKKLKVKVSVPELCPRYLGRVINNLKLAPSPAWLQQKLQACGVRPINNVVDVTNLVMLELGQPLHAFDYRLIKGDEIEVRLAKDGEKMMTLDGKERELTSKMLLITNGKNPLALAGIMGGEDSGIKEDTTEIVLESAQFDKVNILKTSRALGLRSESSARFERGIDWQISEQALRRATQLLIELAGGEVVQTVEVIKEAPVVKELELSLNLVSKLLGLEISAIEAADYLKRLGFAVKDKNKEVLSVTIPSWRQDIFLPADLVEEVGRIYGYEKFESKSLFQELKPGMETNWQCLKRTLCQVLVGCGFDEVYNYSFQSLANGPAVEVLNPLNPEQKYLRQDLKHYLSRNLELNLRNFEKVKIFEIGRVFEISKEELPKEKKRLGLAVGGYGSLKENFMILKSALDVLRDNWVVADEIWERAINFNNLEIKDNGLIFELDLDVLLEQKPEKKKYQTISQYPIVSRDLALVISKNVTYKQIHQAILKIDKLVRRAELFDIFEHEKLGADKRSLAFHLSFQSDEHTLTMEEIEVVFKRILSVLKTELGAEIRG